MKLTEQDILDMTAPEFTSLQRLVISCKSKRRQNAMADGINRTAVSELLFDALKDVSKPERVVNNLKGTERIPAFLEKYGKPSMIRDYEYGLQNLYDAEAGWFYPHPGKTILEKFERAKRQLRRVALGLAFMGDAG